MAGPTKTLPELFDACQKAFPASMKPDSWYLVVASALVTASDPMYLGDLYTYLTGQLEGSSTKQRRVVNRRLREFILKQWVTIGVPKAAVSLFGLIKAEQPGDADLGFNKKYTALDAPNRDRGSNFLTAVYGPERAAGMFTQWGGDMEWLTRDVVYGLFYADDGVLDMLETELITYTGIACQGLHVPLVNHLEGLKRMGLNAAEAEGVSACAKAVADWAGQDTSAWRPVREVIPWD